MINPRIAAGVYRQRGLSLIEMMVAMVAGLIVVGSVLAFTVATVQSNSVNIRATRLAQELRVVMGLVSRELRRAGYDRDALTRVSSGVFDSDYSAVDLHANGSCVVLGYSLQAGDEWKGFRLNRNVGVIEFARFDARPADCLAGTWQEVTEPRTVRITEFRVSERCGAVDVDGACDPTPVPGAEPTQVEVRNFRIELAGRLVSDADVVRRLEDQIRVRADVVSEAPIAAGP